MEMNFCRRCGAKLNNQQAHVFKCDNGHTLYANSSPAVALVLVNSKNQVLLVERAIDPGKGALDSPGGFCDEREPLEMAVEREMQEELGLNRSDYGPLQFVLSGIDSYNFAGETIEVLSSFFWARLNDDNKQLAPADDVQNPKFFDIQQLDIESVYFPAIRQGLYRLREILG